MFTEDYLSYWLLSLSILFEESIVSGFIEKIPLKNIIFFQKPGGDVA